MERRSMIRKAGLGTLGLGLLGTRPATILAQRGPTRSSLEEAVRTGNPHDVSEYILANPRLARRSPQDIRIRALELLEGEARELIEKSIAEDAPAPGAGPDPITALVGKLPPAGVSDEDCLEFQGAAGTLMSEAGDEELREVGERMGGLPVLMVRDRVYRDARLRAVMARVRKVLDEAEAVEPIA